ncbi:MAG TPA: hypothetical protein PKY82_03290 [Pyrinomonadaceae bacterium]|nr:hypothetical protein [Pyrinomonadaceae bacterium]
MKSIALSLIFFVALASQISAQSLLKDGKIPDDLLINLKGYGAWGFGSFEINITSTGDWSYLYKGLTVTIPEGLSIDGKPIKPPRYLKPHLSEQKLKSLIAEFEKMQFLKFSDHFPDPNEDNDGGATDQGRETISIRINGQTKEVSYDLGDFNKRTRILRNLAEKIRGAGVWNYENNEIPENFEVSYQLPDEDNMRREFKIRANGEIIQSIITKQPFSMKVEKAGKISQKKVKQLIEEFEQVGFSVFRFSNLSKYDGCLNEPVSNQEKRKHINVQINYILQMYASLYENCNAKAETNAAKFEYMANVIENLLKEVGTIK